MDDAAYFSASSIMSDWKDFHLDVSFTAEKGSMTCILGQSGSGKSTCLRIIAGLEKSTAARHGRESRILLDGRDISGEKAGKRGIGMVFQTPALFMHMRVDDNVGYGLVAAGMKKREARKRADAFLELFKLSGFSQRQPQTLSGGEAQRVALARTLIVSPKLVLFDEPLSALDAPLRKKLAAEIRSLQKEIGFTGIMVTHDIAEAKAVADRILVMKGGRLVWTGSAADFDESLL